MEQLKTFADLRVGDYVFFLKGGDEDIKWVGFVKEVKEEKLRIKYYALFTEGGYKEGYSEEGYFDAGWFVSNNNWKLYKLNKEKATYQKLIMLYELGEGR